MPIGPDAMSFFEELKRRNVFRVGIAYAVLGWLLLQVTDIVVPILELPEWVAKLVLFLLLIGLPVVLFFAWAFELTPEGVKREKDIDRNQSIAPQTGKKLDRMIILVMGAVIAFLLIERFYISDPLPAEKTQAQAQASAVKSIAVLPFADLSQSGDQEWFADGLAEEILNALAQVPDLQVSSRTSSFKYKGSQLDISGIAKELGVAHVLEGSVRSSADRIRVTAQLIRASDGFHVWSENYDSAPSDMITIQEDLAREIALALETTMDPDALAAMASAGTRSVSAYQEYLRGMVLYQGLDDEAFLEGYEHFERARELDPGFADAHLRSAQFWVFQLTPTSFMSGLTNLRPTEIREKFLERIDQAIATAKDDIDRKGYSTIKALNEMRLRDTIRLGKEYFEQRPGNVQIRFALEMALIYASDKAGIREILDYISVRGMHDDGHATDYLGIAYQEDPDAAADYGLRAMERWPEDEAIQYQTHRSLLWAARVQEAKQIADRFERVHGSDFPLLSARQACAEGRRDDAEGILHKLLEESNPDIQTQWHVLMLLDRKAEAEKLLHESTFGWELIQLASWLWYPQFDPRPFPELMSILKQEGVKRPGPVDIPFKCPPPERPSIAVLPFVNMSADADNEFFSDGISEEILNVLARVRELKVAARTSAFAYKGTNTQIAQIGQELGVNHVLEGSVRKAGNQVRVTAQLIQASDGFHLWSETYDRELDNIFAIQDDIAAAIADALKVSLGLETGAAGNLTGTQSIEAYEHYLQGMSLWHLRTVSSLEQAIVEFEKAIELDPDFAKAHAGLSMAWSVLPGYAVMDESEAYRHATLAANRALEIDPNNVEAMISLGSVARFELKWDEARELFQRAIVLNPSLATAHQWYGGLLGDMGDLDASLASYQQAWSLDPRSRIIGYNLAWRFDSAGRRDEAIALADEVIGFAPDFPDGLGLRLQLAIMAGECTKVETVGHKLAALLNKTTDATSLYMDLCQSADQDARKAAIDTMLAWPPLDFASPEHPTLSYSPDMIAVLVELDRFDEAFTLLQRNDNQLSLWNTLWVRSRKTENGPRFNCDPRVRQLYVELDIPPPLKPIVCE